MFVVIGHLGSPDFQFYGPDSLNTCRWWLHAYKEYRHATEPLPALGSNNVWEVQICSNTIFHKWYLYDYKGNGQTRTKRDLRAFDMKHGERGERWYSAQNLA